MKKKILLMLTLLAGVMTANAADGVTVSNATVIPNGKGSISIDLTNAEHKFKAFQMVVTLPEGLSFKQIPIYDDDEVTIKYYGCEVTKSDRLVNHAISSKVDGQTCSFACLDAATNKNIVGESGTLFTMNITADGSINIGDELDAVISGITFTVNASQEISFDNCNFKITGVENRLIFDETKPLPSFENGTKENVRVIRTIKANEWSTLVLPFTMSSTKAKAAFGDDVQLAEFDGFEVTYTDEADVTPDAIKINCKSFTLGKAGMPGGKLYLIKTSKDIAQFDVDDVTMVDAITEVSKQDENYTPGKFTGTFVPTTIPEDGLFLSENKFWYSTGITKTKGFRCWFELKAVLDKETDFGSRIMLVFDNETTGINDVTRNALKDGKVYDLNGRRVEKPIKGIYIIDGKKVVVK